MNLPNFLTLTRIALIPFFAWFIVQDHFFEAFIVFAIGAFTDFLDGFIARKFNKITPLGQFLDPAADKLFIITSYTAAYIAKLLPLYLLIATCLKELIVLSGYALLCRMLSRKIEVKPNMMGKYSTFFQMITLLTIMAVGLGFIPPGDWQYILFGITVIFIAASTLAYVMRGIRIYSERDSYGN